MGFVGKVFKSIFSPSIPQASTQQPTISGRDLVASTESDAPEAAQMGGADRNKKRRGIESLLVPSETIFKGGN